MSKDRYHNEIDKLKNKVQEMGNLAATMLKESIESLKSFDGEKAKEIISLKTKLSNLDSTIEEESLQLIALHQPVASDMRTLGAILKIITYLNRIGRYLERCADHVCKICEKVHYMYTGERVEFK